MGRIEKEISTSNTGLRDLAHWLRVLRATTGLSYRRLAERTGLHATTLQRAASGNSVPRLLTVITYARACEALPEDAHRMWLRARREHVRSAMPQSRQPAPAPALIRDFADLGAALREMYEEAGAPPVRIMETRAGGFGTLPRSSAHRIVNKQAVPHCLEQFRGYLRACEVPADHWKAWEDAWSRAWRFEKQEDAGLNEVQSVAEFQRPTYEEGATLRFRVDEKADGRRPRYYRPLVRRQRSLGELPAARVAERRGSQYADSRSARAQRAADRLGQQPLFTLPHDITEADLTPPRTFL